MATDQTESQALGDLAASGSPATKTVPQASTITGWLLRLPVGRSGRHLPREPGVNPGRWRAGREAGEEPLPSVRRLPDQPARDHAALDLHDRGHPPGSRTSTRARTTRSPAGASRSRP